MDLLGTFGDGTRATSTRATLSVRSRPVLAPAEYADGRDASQALGDWLRALPPGSTADLGGLAYRCETHLKVTDPRGLTVRNGTLTRTVKTEDPNYYYPKPNPHLWLLRPVDCAVENLTVRGTNTVPDQRTGFGAYLAKYEFDAAIRAEQFTNLTVTGLDADGIWGDGVQLQKGSRAVVRDSLIDRIGRQGVTVIASDVLCDNVGVLHGRRSLFDLEPDSSSQVVRAVSIRNCRGTAIGFPIASAGRGAVNDVLIQGNTFGDGSLIYVGASDGTRRSNWTVTDNVTGGFGSPVAGSRFYKVDGVRFERNKVFVSSKQSRLTVQLSECGGICTIVDNQFGGGLYYKNVTPRPDQVLTVEGNDPALTAL